MGSERAPPQLSEGVRSGILTALQRDVELRGARTARLLAAAGGIGILGAIGATLLIAGHPFDHHPPWHVAFFSAVWAGLLVVSLALAFLQVRTPSLPLARSAFVGIVGLGLAGICGAACPDQHFLHWWSGTWGGGQLAGAGGLAPSALCFGVVTTFTIGVFASALALADGSRGRAVRPFLPATMLLLLLSPGVALQSVGTSWSVLASWLLGTAAGAYAGVAAGIRLSSVLSGVAAILADASSRRTR